MSDFRYENYLRMYRKRAAFSQAEVAFLLGIEGGAEVSRHEQGHRLPSLDTALAYEAIFGQPVGELFAGKLERLQVLIARRARQRLNGAPLRGATLDAITRIANFSLDL
jgi:DNA-binding XRE family transcriptional regulator